MTSIIDKIVQIDFPKNQYIPTKTKKNQIVLHHTVSPNNSIKGDIATWRNSKSRIATCIIIGGDGIPYQLFSSKYWGYHLGIKIKVFNKYGLKYKKLDTYSIGVEIDSAGGLKQKDNGKWYDVYGHHIPDEEVQVYKTKYRGYYGFQKYTPEQIETLRQLLIYWGNYYKIPLDYNETMFDVSVDALKGKSGVWSHTSYRSDKSDIFPQPELIEMLKTLKYVKNMLKKIKN